jgi:hypothetical protein
MEVIEVDINDKVEEAVKASEELTGDKTREESSPSPEQELEDLPDNMFEIFFYGLPMMPQLPWGAPTFERAKEKLLRFKRYRDAPKEVREEYDESIRARIGHMMAIGL